ncbi:MAG: hypothetical protein O2897_01945 [bacterium]|nr:hypothetical protein [bacterium]
MKKIFLAFSTILLISACNRANPDDNACFKNCVKEKQAQATSIEQINEECRKLCGTE